MRIEWECSYGSNELTSPGGLHGALEQGYTNNNFGRDNILNGKVLMNVTELATSVFDNTLHNIQIMIAASWRNLTPSQKARVEELICRYRYALASEKRLAGKTNVP